MTRGVERGRALDPSNDLRGARIGVLEARYGSDLVQLIRQHGGAPVWAPALREVSVECGPKVSAFIDGLRQAARPIVVFQTGAGANALFSQAERLGRLDELVTVLKGIVTVARGPKPGAALSQRGIRASVQTREPYTTAELLEAMSELAVAGEWVGLVHYGERNDALIEALRGRGAELEELYLYEWTMPEDVEPLRLLVREIVGGRVDAVAFTSQVQARHLFRIAEEMELAVDLARSLNSRTAVASVGPTCSGALRSLGVTPRVEPARPKMRPMVTALIAYLSGGGAQEPP